MIIYAYLVFFVQEEDFSVLVSAPEIKINEMAF